MPLVPETAVHGGFSLIEIHFISEITDLPQQPGSLRPCSVRLRPAGLLKNRTGKKILQVILFYKKIYYNCSRVATFSF